VFEVLFGLNFLCQTTTGLRATKQRNPEKVSSITRASSEFRGHLNCHILNLFVTLSNGDLSVICHVVAAERHLANLTYLFSKNL